MDQIGNGAARTGDHDRALVGGRRTLTMEPQVAAAVTDRRHGVVAEVESPLRFAADAAQKALRYDGAID